MGTLGSFFETLSRAGCGVLMLDYDGTLAPFRVERDKAVPYAGVREALTAIVRDDRTRLAIVSGRSVAEIESLLGLRPPPEIWGCHGWEHRGADGRREDPALPPGILQVLEAAWSQLERQGLARRAERKSAAVALHWRGESERDARAIRDAVRGYWQGLAARGSLQVLEFAGGIELRAAGRTKGTVVEAVLAGSDDIPGIAYLGDDVTDEDAFRALAGRGLSVLVAERPRPTAAACVIRPPTELLAFLDRWRRAVAGGPPGAAGGEGDGDGKGETP